MEKELFGLQELLSTKMVSAVAELATDENRQLVGDEAIALLDSPDELIRSDAVELLGALGYVPAVEAVGSLLRNDPSAIVRASAAETLGDIGDPSGIEALKLAFNDPDDAVKSYAFNSFGLLADPGDRSILDGHLHPEMPEGMRANILGAQWRLGMSEACTQFLNLMKSTRPDYVPNVVNVLEDLVDRKNPEGIAENASSFCQALQEMDLSLHGSVRRLIEKLNKLRD